MDKKLTISHTILYAKGWYKRGDLIEDLKITLSADGYSPFTKGDVMSILVARLKNHRMMEAGYLVSEIGKLEWQMQFFGFEEKPHYSDCVIQHCLNILLMLDNKEWEVVLPRYSSVLKRK